MNRLLGLERVMLAGHVVSMVFGLAGLLLVLPHPDFILSLPILGQRAFQWSLMGGGVGYMVMAAIAVSCYAYRVLGSYRWLSFMLPALVISLSSELLGTSTGFPFGEYRYLSGLGYKIAGLVPFTIPLSWFYLGFSVYVLAGAGLAGLNRRLGRASALTGSWGQVLGTIALAAVMLTAWDFVLDPAMSQAPMKFWEFLEAGSFFGMPYRNISGWLATGVLYMGTASLFWGKQPVNLGRSQLTLPLVVYLVNVAFGAVITLTQLDRQFLFPTSLALVLGVVPAIALWWAAGPLLPRDTEGCDRQAPLPTSPLEVRP
ncbi:MAG: carotenoid biosynthesis protein [Synechococcales cyanobacterium CRU_2_2]|nr:carotenoid biosynthesis protein [Synechococcales cyanobacterium CRU_2_2]